jgi:hypothetical protein
VVTYAPIVTLKIAVSLIIVIYDRTLLIVQASGVYEKPSVTNIRNIGCHTINEKIDESMAPLALYQSVINFCELTKSTSGPFILRLSLGHALVVEKCAILHS